MSISRLLQLTGHQPTVFRRGISPQATASHLYLMLLIGKPWLIHIRPLFNLCRRLKPPIAAHPAINPRINPGVDSKHNPGRYMHHTHRLHILNIPNLFSFLFGYANFIYYICIILNVTILLFVIRFMLYDIFVHCSETHGVRLTEINV